MALSRAASSRRRRWPSCALSHEARRPRSGGPPPNRRTTEASERAGPLPARLLTRVTRAAARHRSCCSRSSERSEPWRSWCSRSWPGDASRASPRRVQPRDSHRRELASHRVMAPSGRLSPIQARAWQRRRRLALGKPATAPPRRRPPCPPAGKPATALLRRRPRRPPLQRPATALLRRRPRRPPLQRPATALLRRRPRRPPLQRPATALLRRRPRRPPLQWPATAPPPPPARGRPATRRRSRSSGTRGDTTEVTSIVRPPPSSGHAGSKDGRWRSSFGITHRTIARHSSDPGSSTRSNSFAEEARHGLSSTGSSAWAVRTRICGRCSDGSRETTSTWSLSTIALTPVRGKSRWRLRPRRQSATRMQSLGPVTGGWTPRRQGRDAGTGRNERAGAPAVVREHAGASRPRDGRTSPLAGRVHRVEARMEMTMVRPLTRPALSRVVCSNGHSSPARAVPQVRVGLLGGFRVERLGDAPPVSAWQRRSAKTLTKLLATYPRHMLHREQILDMLWPDVPVESALNSFGKALYAARRALEPELLPRQSSAYLKMTDSMVALDADHVLIDADHFQHLADRALGQRDVAAFEAALEAYGGELLPENRYDDWCTERRDFLAELSIRLLLGLAEALENRGAYGAAANRLREVLQHDPTREDAHRRLMVLYASAGDRDQAVRQFHVCQDVLRRELDLAPEKATVALYQDVLANRIERRSPTPEPDADKIVSAAPRETEHRAGTPFVGRESVLAYLGEQLVRADDGEGRMVLVSGESGVGKTRLVAELATEARRRGAAVLWSGGGAHANSVAYGPFAVALDGYVARLSDAERHELAQRYPALVQLMPSLATGKPVPPLPDGPGDD